MNALCHFAKSSLFKKSNKHDERAMKQTTAILPSKQRGFTLIEVLVALLIVAVALAALSQTLAVLTQQQGGLEQRLYAGWIAQNRLVELTMSLDGEIETQTEVEMAGTTWQTELSLEPTPIPGMMRATLEVKLAGEDDILARMVTVVGQ
jgi:general secretion pathway protein I